MALPIPMKIVLEYTLPDDQYNMWCAYNASHLFTTIREIEQYLREVRKYDADPQKALERIEESLREMYAITGEPLNG
jgi:DNA-directed RNA polymerase subunit L